MSTARFIAYTDTGCPSEASASISAMAGPSRSVFQTGRMFSRPARNSLSYVGSIEMPWESTPRRSVSTITAAVVAACASDMPQARRTLTICAWIREAGTRVLAALIVCDSISP